MTNENSQVEVVANESKINNQRLNLAVKILLIFLPIWAIVFNLNLDYVMGIQIYTGVYYGVFVTTCLILVFLMYPARKEGSTARWYDFIFMGVGAVPCIYFAYMYKDIVLTGGVEPGYVDVILGSLVIVSVLEAVRRTTGWFMVLVAVFFIIHGLFANFFPSFLKGPSVGFDRFVTVVYQSDSGMFGMIMRAITTYLIAFATFGAFMIALGAGEKFVNLALSLVGHVKGGAAKMSVISSGFLGTLTGCPIGNVGISGAFTIPLMKKTGFSPAYASAVETTASVGGVIMPPMMGAIIFIMVEVTGIPYVEIIKAALFPAILYFVAVFFQISFYSSKHEMTGLQPSQLPDRKKSIYESKYLFVTFGLLIYFLVGLYLFPVRAAYYTLFCMIALFIIDRSSSVTWRKIVDGLELSTRNTLPVVPIACAAGIILGSISLTGTGIRLASNVVELAGGNLLVLTIVLAVVCYLLGLGISAMLAYILLSTLVAPALVEMGVPTIAAHFFIIYMGLSGFFTPPYAVVALMASSVGGADFYQTCIHSMKMAVVAYIVPITLILDPVLLYQDVLISRFIFRIIVSLIAIYLLSAGLEGYLYKRKLLWMERIVLSIGSLLLFVPYIEFIYIGGLICLTAIGLYIFNSRKISQKAELRV